MQRASCPAAVGAQGVPLRWSTERSPAQRGPLHGQRATSFCRRRRQRPGDDLACRTLEPGRLLFQSGGNFVGGGYSSSFGSGGQSSLLAFQPNSSGGGGSDVSQADVSGFLGNGSGGRGLPKETFQQLRQAAAVLTSLDLADNAEHTVDYEDGAAELAEDILLESQPSAKEVGKSVFETLRIDQAGKTRRVYVRRRDLIRAHGLQPRDLRRVDPSLSPTKVSPSVTIKEECVLLNIGGVRAVVTEDKCLLFEPNSPSSRKFLEIVMPKIQAAVAANQRRAAMKSLRVAAAGGGGGSATASAAAASDDLLGAVVGDPMEGDYYGNSSFEDERIFPFELEMLEGALMVATGKLDAELVAATRRVSSMLQKLPREITPVNLEELRRVKQLLVELESKAENMRDLLEELMDDEEEFIQLNLSSRPRREERRKQRERDRLEREMEREREREADRSGASEAAGGSGASALKATSRPERIAQLRERLEASSDNGARKGGDDEDGGFQDAQDALEEMQEEEEEERELEEVEDLLEYYLQRAANTQSEAERLLAGARDLEESIGVSLSARRFEVNRLELLLSIASFAAALGAMVAGIFGMNLRSTLEMSVIGFWGTTALIILGSYWVFYLIFKYTKRKRIL